MKISKCREIEERVRQLVREGWEIWRGGKHTCIKHPNGYQTTVPGTPGDRRAVLNFEAEIRRAARNGYKPRQGGFVPIYVLLPLTVVLMLLVFGIALAGFVEFAL